MSTSTTQSRAPGWFPDPMAAEGQRWWDGQQWTGRRALAAEPEPLAPLGERFAVLGDLLGRLLLANAALSLLTVGIEQVAPGRALSQLLALLALALLAPTALVWCAWQWRLATSSPDRLRWAPRMHVVAWLVPVMNLWVPIQNMVELWHAYEPPDPRGRGQGIPLVLPWWACWLVSTVLGVAGLGTLLAGAAPDAYLGVAWGLAAILAWVVVRRLSWRALCYHAGAH